MTQASLPVRIMQMIGALHRRGFESLYLHSGLSPSGSHWRYAIGVVKDGCWPSGPSLVAGSVGGKDTLNWSARIDPDPEVLADRFEAHFADQLLAARTPNSEFVDWYSRALASLPEGTPLIFFADYGGPHRELLATAPGYTGRR